MPPLDRAAAELMRVPGVVAARPFSVNVVLGDRTPAFHPELVMCELTDAGYDRDAAVAAVAAIGADGTAGAGAVSDGARVVAWDGASVGERRDFELPDHLYLQFSAQPASLSFAAYSDWYQAHQDENIAQSEVLRQGWRYRLERLGGAPEPGPTHLAVYELDGTLEVLTADLGRAMRAGVISLPDWFTRFASLEAIAVGGRMAV
jgi:hypothetical protein